MINTGMIPRKSYESALEKALKRSPVVSLLGPRQCGKTTLARMNEKIDKVPAHRAPMIQVYTKLNHSLSHNGFYVNSPLS